MATKAELETELAQLKAQLAANSTSKDPEPTEGLSTEGETQPELELSEDMLKDLAKELETFAKEKPMITLLAVFLVGYVVGRAR